MSAADDILRHPGVLATADAEIAVLLAAFRAEVLHEAADLVDAMLTAEPDTMRASALYEALLQLRGLLPCTCARSQGLHERKCRRYVAGHELLSPIRALATYRAAQTEAAGQAGKVIPKDETTQPADFFQPGHGYTHRSYGNDFHCVTVTTHPVTGQRLAMGWLSEHGEWHRPHVVGINQWNHEYDGVQAPEDTEETTAPEPATVEFTDGTVTLTRWRLAELAPDYHGISHMQIGGWLPESWEPGSIALGTNCMVHADLPGASAHAHNINVQIDVKGYGEPQRFMKIQWRHAYDPTKDHRRTGGDAR